MEERSDKPVTSTLFNGWNWSEWVLAMTPSEHENFRNRQRNRSGYRITNQALKDHHQFRNENSCGIYEWMTKNTRTGSERVVYIGCTYVGSNGSFIDRIEEYCYNGSDKAAKINEALRKRCQLWVRYRSSDPGDYRNACDGYRRIAEEDESRVLEKYVYDWND